VRWSSSDSDFGAVLRRLREDRALTQEELAGRSGVSAKAIGALERGERRRPHPHTVRALADALRLDDAERAGLVRAVPARGEPSEAETGAPPAWVPPATTGRLAPAAVAPLFGRDEDLVRLEGLLAGQRARLVTLTGPGGVGKTRLATEVATRVTDLFTGGVRLVDLAAVREPSQVLPHVAVALGVVEQPAGTVPLVEQVAAHLADRRVLLVLDNVEQVTGCGPGLAELVALAPGLTVLATSRAPLRVRAEQEVPLAALTLPVAGDGRDVADSPAVAMFLDRASAAGAHTLRDGTAPATLAAIARHLDGLPLAIELAAAATRVLPADALLARLESGSADVGVPGPRDLPDRQRSMSTVLDGSVELLEPRHRALFLRSAVFTGGFSLDWLEAVEAGVTGRPGDAALPGAELPGAALHGDAALPGVAALVEQALVLPVPSPDGTPRFRLLEPVRQYAIARAHVEGHALAAAEAHAVQAREVALAAHRRLWARDVGPVLDRLDADHGNLRAGFLRLLELDRVADAADLAGSLWPYFAMRGRVREGLEWLDRAAGAGTPSAVARAAVGRMGLLLVVGDVVGLRRLGEVATGLADRAGETLLVVEATLLSGLGALFAGDLVPGERLLAQAEGRAADLGGEEGGDGDPRRWVRLHVQLGRGQAVLLAGDAEAATGLLEEAVSAARALGNEFGLATALNTLATARQHAGADADAAALLGESLAVSFPLRLAWTLGYAVPEMAGVAARSGRPEAAAFLFGAAATLGDATAVDPHYPPSRATVDAGLVAARTRLGPDEFAAAWEAGRTATPEEVGRFAAEVAEAISSPGEAHVTPGRG
jgi:predicted ATPase/DNA-binding XRE family transcriptional regulator